MSPATITGSEKPIRKIFCDDFVFSIPPYQRPYAWTTEHAEELLDDLLTFVGDDDQTIDGANPYFLGSIVLIKGSGPESDVVDGQQRLTTITILLSALRELLPADAARDLTPFLYQQGSTITNEPNRYRLKLRPRDEAFFRKYIQDEDGIGQLKALNCDKLTDSQANVCANARHYLKRLSEIDEVLRVRLAQFIISQCFLVVVATPDFDSAYRIFSVLNSRGLELSHTDILKSDLIGKVPEAQQDEYTEKWENAEAEVGRAEFQDLFSHIRTIYRKVKQRGTVLKEFQDYVLHKNTSREVDSRQFIEDILLPYSEAFRDIIKQTYTSHGGEKVTINWLLRWLNRIDNFDWIPPAIVYLSRHANEPERLVRFFTDLERLAAGLMILRANINTRIERHGALLRAIEHDADLFSSHAPLQLDPRECNEISHALNGDIYLMNARLRQYILMRLDEALSGGIATYDYPTISIEHVLPQNPAAGSVWATWFPDPRQHSNVVHRLGNLVLLSRRKNSAASNYDFEKKKHQYFTSKTGTSPFALTTQVLRETTWTSDVVERRQRDLHHRLKELWRL